MDTTGYILFIASSVLWFIFSLFVYFIPALKNINNRKDFFDVSIYLIISFTPIPGLFVGFFGILFIPPLILFIIYILLKWIINNLSNQKQNLWLLIKEEFTSL